MKYILAIILSLFSIATMAMIDQTYQKPRAAILKQKLTPTQYQVTQEAGTEPAFDNAYWNNEAPEIYVDIVSGKPLFISLNKYE